MAILNRVSNTMDRTEEVTSRKALAVGLGTVSVGILAYVLRDQIFGRRGLLEKKVKSIMTKNPVSTKRNTPLAEVARLMVERNCGEIPVVDQNNKPIGVVTDRDIVCRTLAKGLNPINVLAESVMSAPVKTVRRDADITECIQLMERNHVRRIPVVDDRGSLCGVVSQTDIMARVSHPSVAA